MLLSHGDLPALQQLIPLFDGLLHLSAIDQNIIISDASNLLGQEAQEFIGSLLAAHNRQAQSWLHINTTASEEYRSEALSRVDQASVNSSCEPMEPQQLPDPVATVIDMTWTYVRKRNFQKSPLRIQKYAGTRSEAVQIHSNAILLPPPTEPIGGRWSNNKHAWRHRCPLQSLLTSKHSVE